MSLFETPTFKKEQVREPKMEKPPTLEEYFEIAFAEKKVKMKKDYEIYKRAFNKMISEANKSGKGSFNNSNYDIMNDRNEMYKLVRDQCIYELKEKGYDVKVYRKDESSYDDSYPTYVFYLEFV